MTIGRLQMLSLDAHLLPHLPAARLAALQLVLLLLVNRPVHRSAELLPQALRWLHQRRLVQGQVDEMVEA